ncbi:MAG: NUDIX hydrolase [Planctomycetes bacterium]|nr:NUDIX hydrolase [Planctomycetota bacterium]
MMQGTGPLPWPRRRSERGPDLIIFRSRRDSMENPRTGEVFERLVLEAPPWVNVVALTPEGLMVFVRQYRFGIGAITTEIPGGVIGREESVRDAAERELREETGYTASHWEDLGCVEANPAFQNNVCHHWLARGAVKTHPLELDDGEDIAVTTLTPAEVRSLVASGAIRHSLVICALARVLDLRGADPPAGARP